MMIYVRRYQSSILLRRFYDFVLNDGEGYSVLKLFERTLLHGLSSHITLCMFFNVLYLVGNHSRLMTFFVCLV